LPNLAAPDDIAQAALFLASDAARLITGYNLIIDGGIMARWPAATAREDLQRFRDRFRAEILAPWYCSSQVSKDVPLSRGEQGWGPLPKSNGATTPLTPGGDAPKSVHYASDATR
jgi:hypothetical protein